MRKRTEKCTVLMVGPAASVKGGIRTVVDNYLAWQDWGQVEITYVPTYIDSSAVKKLLCFMGGFLRICAICATRRVDIAHLHVSERGSFWRKAMVLSVCKAAGAKVIFHHHGAEFYDFYDNASPRAKKTIARVIARADANLVLSRCHRQMMLDRFPQGNFSVLYNAVIPSGGTKYHPEARGIAFVGRLGRRKGTYDVINVMEQIEAELPADVRFFFCGDGEVEQVTGLLREKGLMHRVGHLGWCSKEQLGQILSQTMIFILPSYHEGLPMSLLEAMYAGIPCISSNVDAIPEAIESGCNGILVEPGNLDEIRNALMELAQNPEERAALGKKAHDTVCASFLLEKHVANLTALYKNLKNGENNGKAERQNIKF